jgi:hypothetical protein
MTFYPGDMYLFAVLDKMIQQVLFGVCTFSKLSEIVVYEFIRGQLVMIHAPHVSCDQ